MQKAVIKQTKEAKSGLVIVDMLADFGIEKWEGNRSVDTVVVHTAYSLEGEPYDPKNVYNIFKKYNVTSHYLIGRDGVIYRLADENDLAHHAGKSKMADGREGVNAFSIGIELINSQTDYPTKAQYTALAKLIKDIKRRHKIEHIVGHKDIAPTRKSDPWNFDFNGLAKLLEN
jgi:N-acetyl-anhydromuramyl-L-alanine amidase AmpD